MKARQILTGWEWRPLSIPRQRTRDYWHPLNPVHRRYAEYNLDVLRDVLTNGTQARLFYFDHRGNIQER